MLISGFLKNWTIICHWLQRKSACYSLIYSTMEFAALTQFARFKTKKNVEKSLKNSQVGEDVIEDSLQIISPDIKDSDEALNVFRKRLMIKVYGQTIAKPVTSFSELPIAGGAFREYVLSRIEESRWKEPTAIQMQAIPVLLEGKDLLAAAPTGSGKTGAFLIPLISRLYSSKGASVLAGVRGLVLSPTKELSEQTYREAVRLCGSKHLRIKLLNKNLLTSITTEQAGKSVLGKIDILVSTPLRLLSLLKQTSALDLSQVSFIVLDEVDKLMEFDGNRTISAAADEEDIEEEETNENTPLDCHSSFLTQMDDILSYCPHQGVQKALFSATIGSSVHELAGNFLVDPVSVTVGIENSAAVTIDQRLIFVGREEGKLLAVRQIIQQGQMKPPVLIFTQSIDRAKELFLELVYEGINVDVMHSERTEQQREQLISGFRAGDIWVLICTDLMARGLDFKRVNMVINFDLPQTPVAYIHRIGRTGRGNNRGSAVTFFTETDIPRLRAIANVMRLSGCDVPDWMLSIKQVGKSGFAVWECFNFTATAVIRSMLTALSTKKKREFRRSAPERHTLNTSLKKRKHPTEEKNNHKK